jgi:hypothetical protein
VVKNSKNNNELQEVLKQRGLDWWNLKIEVNY